MMVLSGANITMFITFINALLVFLPKKIREVLSMVITSIFLGLIPIQPSIIRATFMNYLPRIGELIGRQTNKMYLLFFSCCLILCFDIQIIYNISFQLSFMAMFGIILFYRDVSPPDNKISIVNIIRNMIVQQVALGLSAQVFTAPLIFYYFGNISILGIFASAIIAPLISPIMVCTILLVSIPKNLIYITAVISIILKLQLNMVIFLVHTLSRLSMFYIQY